MAVVAGGAAGAQVITMAFSPLITRLYGPEAFGLAGAFVAIVSVIAPTVAMAYPIAIVLPKEETDAVDLIRLSFYIAVAVSALAFLVFGLMGETVLKIVALEQLAPFALLIPVVLFISAWIQIAQYFLVRHNAFRITARITVLQTLIINSAKAVLGAFFPFGAVLIGLQAAGSALNGTLLTVAASKLWRTNSKSTRPGQDAPGEKTDNLLSQAKKYKDFPLFRAPQNLINAVSQSLPIVILAALFGPAAAGFYALGRTVLGLPSSLVAQAVGTVFYSRISEAGNSGEKKYPLILKATLGLAAVGAVPFAVIFFFGPWLFEFVFGVGWAGAGVYASWLSLMYFFNFTNRASVAAIPILGLQKGLLIYEIFSTGTKIVALYVGFQLYKSDEIAVALFSVFGMAAYAILIIWVLIASRTQDKCIYV